jgi:acetylornithine deacetylase/succinyl-diaminopimelate desuccinylase-like protein
VSDLWDTFARFVALDTAVRHGESRLDSHDERIARFVREGAVPVLEELGANVEIDALNNVVAHWGELTGRELLLVGYPAIHHGNEMPDPLRARSEQVDGEEVWVGLGASQGKAGLAAACEAIRLLRQRGHDPQGEVVLAVCSEGGSSHTSIASLLARVDPLPAGAVLTMGTGNAITLGNRGRVDVVVEIPGRATHSSAPERGSNPIPVVADVLARLEHVRLEPGIHAQLGSRTLVPYKLVCEPVLPHTIPSRCELVLDRRLLPGDDPDEAVDGIAATLADLRVRVSRGAVMLPALVDESAAVVRALQAGAVSALGHSLETLYRRDTFDAGYPCSLGVPTVMCGPSSSDFGGEGVLGVDAVAAADVRRAAEIYAGAVAPLGALP